MKKKLVLLLASMLLIIGLLTGCGSGSISSTSADDPAIKYVTAICNGKWDEVIKGSTGDQLAIYTQLVPVLQSTKQTSEVKRVEVVDRAMSSNKQLSFVTVHFVRSVTIANYGSTLDDKQVLLSMKQVDGQWKVFKMDVVNDLKTKLSGN